MSGLNRVLLVVLGLVVAVAGACALLISSGLLGLILTQLGSTLVQPDASAPILTGRAVDAASSTLLLGVAGAGVVVAALSIWWVVTQVRRPVRVSEFRLHADPAEGSTVVVPAALNRAIASQIEQLPGVVTVTASVAGAAQAPQLLVRVTVDDRSDIVETVRRINADVAAGLASSLGGRLDWLGILVDVGRQRTTVSEVEVSAAPELAG